ncbi:hypothetical protein EDD18DRAFT_1114205 [Armillaria luteobubalina]|uniref:Uncharacterized protein n=1 Tax=Armillaria luteobubalina TaxID=153913 RepID=A0AA39P6A2_9AGAR|nr:hypothetical protein EDD18DRAFT_1114205 [Armillaria luteobubalina]
MRVRWLMWSMICILMVREISHLHSHFNLSLKCLAEDEDGNSSNPITNAADEILDLVNPYNPQFQIKYHPSALLDPHILTCEEYFQMTALEMTDSFVNNCPWHPFASERNFELAELILCTGMNHQARDSYFKVLKIQAGDHPSAYTINNQSDLNDAWSKAEHLLTMLDEKTNTKMWIFDEPWTGNVLWEVQSSLPPGGKPLAYILYADKTCLSSFGTAKGYPVIACIANLPDTIQNGKDWGGGTVVGWLPVVEDDPKHKGKPSWINFKRVVWHESFRKIIKSIEDYSYAGYAFNLPHSGCIVVIYPFILILCADYEEQIFQKYMFHEQQKKCKNFMIVQKMKGKGFWIKLVCGMLNDPYKAVSWDQLHAYHLGVFRHLLNRLLEHIENIPGAEKRHAKVVIDEFINNFPRWKDFTHFTNVTTFV